MTSDDLESGLAPEALNALQHAKSAFIGAQADRCGYLRVAFERHPESGELSVGARFTLKPRREWHHVDASIKLSDLEGSDPQPAVRRAFADLADSVATVSIAHLFRPVGSDARLD